MHHSGMVWPIYCSCGSLQANDTGTSSLYDVNFGYGNSLEVSHCLYLEWHCRHVESMPNIDSVLILKALENCSVHPYHL